MSVAATSRFRAATMRSATSRCRAALSAGGAGCRRDDALSDIRPLKTPEVFDGTAAAWHDTWRQLERKPDSPQARHTTRIQSTCPPRKQHGQAPHEAKKQPQV